MLQTSRGLAVLLLGLASILVASAVGASRAQAAATVAQTPADAQSAAKVVRVVVDLPRAIQLALQNNSELKASQSDIRVAAAQRDQAAAGHWPSLRAQAGFTEYRRAQRLYPAASPGELAVVSHHMVGGDLVVSFPLYSGGQVTGQIDIARRAEDAARRSSEWTEAELTFQVTATYYGILAQRRLLEALSESESVMVRSVEQIAALVEERKAAPLDRQRMDVRLASLRQRRIQEQASLDLQRALLFSLIGLDGSASSVEVTGDLGKPIVTPVSSAQTSTSLALARRADLSALRAAVQAQERRLDVARAGHYPEVGVQGSYGLRWGIWPSEHPDGVSTLADVGQVGVYLGVPLFEGGRVSAEVREEQARLESLRQRLRQAELRARLELEAARLDFSAAVQRVALSDATIGQAIEAFRVETEKYTMGKSTISEVLSAQTDLLDAEATRARTLADANIAAAALKRASGDAP